MLLYVQRCVSGPSDLQVSLHIHLLRKRFPNSKIHDRKPLAKNTIIQEYVLPDFIHNTTGHIRTKEDKILADQQILTMNNERFMIPEILMHPSDIGLEQAGIPEAITQSVNACDPGMKKKDMPCVKKDSNPYILMTTRHPWTFVCKYRPCRWQCQHPRILGKNVSS